MKLTYDFPEPGYRLGKLEASLESIFNSICCHVAGRSDLCIRIPSPINNPSTRWAKCRWCF